MDTQQPLALLAGLSPAQFMRRHWQKKPLLVRGAIPGFAPLLSRAELFKLASNDGVESRLIVKNSQNWRMKSGPFAQRALPPLKQPGWTLLVQGVDGHDAAVNQLLQQFRFVPDARLDDLMISWATTGGGVGPHFDSYDVFLLQASGSRRWRISQQKDLTLQEGMPLKILQNFEPEQEFVLHAGDMLYLPPRYAHDGVAVECTGSDGKVQDCMTYSIGFKAPVEQELAAELLHRLAEFNEDALEVASADSTPKMYRDAGQAATTMPAQLPQGLVAFAQKAVQDALKDPLALGCALGEIMTSLKPQVWFEECQAALSVAMGVRLDAKTRMMYDENHIFINGESYRAKGADAVLMRLLADQRELPVQALRKASQDALSLLADWQAAGWLHAARESV
ncbi:MAG: cupin domain-containing protein [Polaromonas sp.]